LTCSAAHNAGAENLAIQYITVNRKRLHKQKEAVQHPGRPEWEDESELRAELPGAGGAVQPPPESAAANGGAGGGGGGGVKRGHDETLDGYADEAEDGVCPCHVARACRVSVWQHEAFF
jgi:hypothetical protein